MKLNKPSSNASGQPEGALRAFLRTEASSSVLLACGALIALVWANSPWGSTYDDVWSHDLHLVFGNVSFFLDARHWVNDAIMTIFFLVVGLEIKHELTKGHLNNVRAALMPCVAALGGMVVPALVYLAIAGETEPRGWAIPVATDIALAVGALAVVGGRVPPSGRVFLLALAIVDDIGAIVVIAVAFSKNLQFQWLAVAAFCVGLTLILQKLSVGSLIPYVALGILMWCGLYQAGVHPTLAGVVMGLLAPPSISPASEAESLIQWLQRILHPWSSFVIVPIFALANAGVRITADTFGSAVRSPLTWGVFLGLLIGKPLGVSVSTRLASRFGVAELPTGLSRRQVTGLGSTAGIGFTVAMFITELALSNDGDVANAKLAIFAASLLSAVAGVSLLRSRLTSANS